jgi:hypothetical protein
MQPATGSHKPGPVSVKRSREHLEGREKQVLRILAESSRPVTLLQLQVGTSEPPNEIRSALEALTKSGFVSHLNTVIDSWVCRAPLCVLPGGAAERPEPPAAA